MDAEKSKGPNPWLEHVKQVRAKNPGKPLKEVMAAAKSTYKKKEKVPKA
jgi:hypothetical protein